MGAETNLGQRRALNLAPWLLLLLALQAHAVQIDGRIAADEWLEARHITDFRKTQPLNGEPATLGTEAWILATPEGLAVAFRNTQPPSVPRTLQRVQRDFQEQVDRVNVIVDFDGDHRTGYDFIISNTDGIADSIVTNESQFNYDWDGNWQHAVGSDDEGWTVEVLIPWHIAPMRAGGQQAHAGCLPGSGSRFDRRTRRVAAGELRAATVHVRLRTHRGVQLQPVAAGHHAVRLRTLRRGRQGQRRRCRCRRVLETEWADTAHGHGESGFRPGGKRRPGGEFQCHRNFHQRQATVFHGKPGHLRVHHAFGFQPVAVHAASRRPGR